MSNPGIAGLTAWWRLNESSGTRADAHGGNALTDNNTVAAAAGKHGQAADFEADNSEYLSRADNAALSLGDVDATLGAWARLESKGAARTILGKFESSGNQREYRLLYDSALDRFVWSVSSDGTSGGEVTVRADALGSPATNTWYFLVAWHDAAGNQLGIQVNNGSGNTAAQSAGIFDGTAAFRIGAAGGPSQFMDGRVDEAFLYKRLLTAAERAWLYNSGAGRHYLDVAHPMPQPVPLGGRIPAPAIRRADARRRLRARARRLTLTAERRTPV
jgi:hypothetical protein